MSQDRADPFPAQALAANRGGHLTLEQAAPIRKELMADKGNRFFGGIALVVVGGMLLVAAITGRAPGGWSDTILLALVAAGAGLLLAYPAWVGRRQTTAALEDAGTVTMAEGILTRELVHSRGSGASSRGAERFLVLDGRRFRVTEDQWAAAPPDGVVRLYLLGETGRIVNAEWLGPDPMLLDAEPTPVPTLPGLDPPPDATDSPAPFVPPSSWTS